MAIMSIAMPRLSVRAERLDVGAKLVALAGVAAVGYGLVFIVLNFTSFVEIGLTASQQGGDRGSIQGFSPQLFRYVAHLQVNSSATLIAHGLAIAALAWFGIRRGQRWALWTAAGTYLLSQLIIVPDHLYYGFTALGHIGPAYLATALVVAGSALAYSGLPARRV